MEKIVIQHQMNKKQYLSAAFVLLYRRPGIWLITVFGILVIGWGIWNLVSGNSTTGFGAEFDLIYGCLILLLLPLAGAVRSLRMYSSSKRLSELRQFEFSTGGFKVSSPSAAIEYQWDGVHKIEEMRNWLLIFVSRLEVYHIPKSAFSAEQLSGVQEMTTQSPKLKTNWKVSAEYQELIDQNEK